MFGIMLLKIWHKKWMNLCILLGCILLVATVVSFPIYQRAAYDRMLNDEFRNSLSHDGRWPTLNTMTAVSKFDKEGKNLNKMKTFMDEIYDKLQVTEKETIFHYSLTRTELHSTMNRDDASIISLRLAAMSDLPLHTEMLSGEMYSDTGITDDGAIEVVLPQSALVSNGLLVGETLVFDSLVDGDGNEIKLYVKGVFQPSDAGDFYWQKDPELMYEEVFMNMDLYEKMFLTEHIGDYMISCDYYSLFEYDDITSEQVDYLMAETNYLTEKSAYRSVMNNPLYMEVLDDYCLKRDRISATLLILQIPVLVMLAAFLLMISSQMYEMEKNEISVIKSRGSSRSQIFRLYLYQGLLLTILGAIAGVPLGMLFAKLLGATRNFLEFDTSRTLQVSFTKDALWYALAAMGITLLSITLPAIRHSKVSIVNLKQSRAVKKKSWWEKLYLDIVLLGVSIYGYYSFHKNMSVAESVMAGESLDPLLYISSSLFILGCGLLFLRLQPYLVQLVYLIGKNHWGPASYVSFMENHKNGRKQQLIMLFLIMTVSLGMYHAAVARTILDNAVENEEYLDGTDIVIREIWTQQVDESGNPTGVYLEPDYSKFASFDGAASYTRVYHDISAFTSVGSERVKFNLLGVHTKDFGNMTMVNRSILSKHYYEYLNELAVSENGILVSSNFKTKLGFDVGDSFVYTTGYGNSLSGQIVDFIDYFPGYSPTVTEMNADGTVTTKENYLVVTHYDLLRSKCGVQPYDVWIDLKDGVTSADVYNWLSSKDIRVQKYVNRMDDVEETMQDPLLQGTNGVLTMGFVVTIVLCAVGYLIYWVMSIRERELIFGVLRACGFHKSEIFHVIINEQIFSGVLSVLAGIGIGKITSQMFVPVLQQAYASVNQVLPMMLIENVQDMIRLYGVIAAVMLLAIVVLVVILFKMNVAKALKLGEE